MKRTQNILHEEEEICGETRYSGRKIKWFAPFRLRLASDWYELTREAMQFFFSYYTLQLILIYFVARDSPERSNLSAKLLSTRFSTSVSGKKSLSWVLLFFCSFRGWAPPLISLLFFEAPKPPAQDKSALRPINHNRNLPRPLPT